MNFLCILYILNLSRFLGIFDNNVTLLIIVQMYDILLNIHKSPKFKFVLMLQGKQQPRIMFR